MNNTSNLSQPLGDNPSEGTANSESSSQPGRCVLEPLCSAANEGAHRAKAAAQRALPKIKAAAASATYWLGYGLSFATVFSCTIVKELAPEVLKAGCRDGAGAGQKTAENLASELKGRPDAHSVTTSPGNDSSGTSTQPSIA